ncbi:hypothetical protein PVL29_011437 [Vitis rotundifolia]|uniref:Uncharacterized protein n=1 Tax=Vitis rotundifolia TaxID=103349 RepID=A0AA39DPJ9_VITRO|nr:hypothetical protein PVL29_011437 [Vitis rotundifolia]
MASLSLSLSSPFTLSSSTTNLRQRSRRRISTTLRPPSISPNSWRHRHIICMAPEEEKMTRRSPLDFPIEWERPKPGRRPDIFPQFSPMKTPLPLPSPADPPEEDEEEEEKKEEEEEDPEKEEPDNPEKPASFGV